MTQNVVYGYFVFVFDFSLWTVKALSELTRFYHCLLQQRQQKSSLCLLAPETSSHQSCRKFVRYPQSYLSSRPELAIALKLRNAGVFSRVDDSNTSIGKRYSRNDELGTPFGITIDFACVSPLLPLAFLLTVDMQRCKIVPLHFGLCILRTQDFHY